jgi:hypothetical protein
MGGTMNKKIAILLTVLVVVLAGCTVPFRKTLDSYLAIGDYVKADALIEKEKAQGSEYSDKNELLYYFDKGSVTQMLGQYKMSSDFLSSADDMIEKNYTRSAVDEANSFMSNDLSLKYSGEDFEQVMVNTARCLNYMYEGKFDDARIEAKKIDAKINWFADTYGEKTIYKDDAFARYLSAFSYEAKGELNDAYIDYKKSLKAYESYAPIYGTEVPGYLKQDLLRTATALKFNDDVDGYKKKFGDVVFTSDPDLRKSAEVLVVVYDGLPAYKVEGFNHFPSFEQRPYAVENIKITSDSPAEFYDAQDVSKMAVKNLEVRIGQIMLKKLGSSVVKSIAKQIPGLNLFVQEDKADTRSWRTIPARFLLSRLVLKPGESKITVTIFPRGYAEGGGTILPVTKEFDLKLSEGEKKAVPVFFFE